MRSPLQPLDRWLLRNRRAALLLAATLAAFVPVCWIVIQTTGAFPGDRGFRSWLLFPHPSQPFAFIAHGFALLGNPAVAALSVTIAWAIVDRRLGHRNGALVLLAAGAVALNTILKTILGPTDIGAARSWPESRLRLAARASSVGAQVRPNRTRQSR